MRWAVELGRVDILYEVATMLTHLVMPRIGHLEKLLHNFGYLKQRPKRKLAFDPDHPMIDERRFKQYVDDVLCMSHDAMKTIRSSVLSGAYWRFALGS